MGPLIKSSQFIWKLFSHWLYPICVSHYLKYNFLFQRISLYIILAMLKKHIPMGYHPLFLILLSLNYPLTKNVQYFHISHSSSCFNRLYRSGPRTFAKLQKSYSRPQAITDCCGQKHILDVTERLFVAASHHKSISWTGVYCKCL